MGSHPTKTAAPQWDAAAIDASCDPLPRGGLAVTDLAELEVTLEVAQVGVLVDDHALDAHRVGPVKLRMMKDDAVLINTSRAGIVRQAALEKALHEGRLYGYATDVYAGEPPHVPDFASLPNVIVTPHAGSATYESNLRMGMAVADNIIAVKNGVEPPNLVTPLTQLYG